MPKRDISRERDIIILAAMRMRESGYSLQEVTDRYGSTKTYWSNLFKSIRDDLAASECA